jgi:hypothetical protein
MEYIDIMIALALVIIKFVFIVVEALVWLGMFGAGLAVIGLAGIFISEWVNNRNAEKAYYEDDESYVTEEGHVVLVPSEEAMEICDEMDRRADEKIFQNTEEI